MLHLPHAGCDSSGALTDDRREFELAIRDYTDALAVDPGNAFALYNRGISHDRSGNFSAAVRDFSRAIELSPTNADFFHNRGFCFRKQGNYEAAIKAGAVELS